MAVSCVSLSHCRIKSLTRWENDRSNIAGKVVNDH